MTSDRSRILDRVRRALRVPAPQPIPPATTPVFETIAEPHERFRKEFCAVNGEWLDGPDELRAFLAGFSRIATDGSERVAAVVGASPQPVRLAELGVTSCECLVAQTGSILVSSRPAGGRLMSVLPPVHLVMAGPDQVVPDLATALRIVHERYCERWPSALSLITGPSRTADIEKNLVLGAHGPKRLVLYCGT